MAFSTAKLSELPLRSSFPLTSQSPSLNSLLFSVRKPSFHLFLKPLCSIRTTDDNKNSKSKSHSYSWDAQTPKPSQKPAPWLQKWPSSDPPVVPADSKRESNVQVDRTEKRNFSSKDKGQNAIDRIVLRLRNLGLGLEDEEGEVDSNDESNDEVMAALGEEKLGDLLKREWIRPDTILEESEDEDEMVLPWEKEEHKDEGEMVRGGLAKRRPKAPSLAELTIEDGELRRLRRMGMYLRERINVPKAGITQAVLDKIHDKWRKQELVRLKFHEVLAHDMKTAHEITEVCLSLF